MKRSALFISTLAIATPVAAFTNGSIVPAYICDAKPDGLPKSFGQLLPYTREMTGPIAFNPNATDNLANAPMLQQATNSTSQVGNSAYILASFHNTLNSLAPIEQGIVVMPMNGGPLIAGQANQLNLSSGVTGVNLDGAMLYAQEQGVRIGSFTDKGGMGIFKDFPGCGKNADGKFAGVIQQMIISQNESYPSLFYNVPACVKSGNITMAGLSVTDGGFGVWKYTFAVTGSMCTQTTTSKTVCTKVNEHY
jgi:hypothetical protein